MNSQLKIVSVTKENSGTTTHVNDIRGKIQTMIKKVKIPVNNWKLNPMWSLVDNIGDESWMKIYWHILDYKKNAVIQNHDLLKSADLYFQLDFALLFSYIMNYWHIVERRNEVPLSKLQDHEKLYNDEPVDCNWTTHSETLFTYSWGCNKTIEEMSKNDKLLVIFLYSTHDNCIDCLIHLMNFFTQWQLNRKVGSLLFISVGRSKYGFSRDPNKTNYFEKIDFQENIHFFRMFI